MKKSSESANPCRSQNLYHKGCKSKNPSNDERRISQVGRLPSTKCSPRNSRKSYYLSYHRNPILLEGTFLYGNISPIKLLYLLNLPKTQNYFVIIFYWLFTLYCLLQIKLRLIRIVQLLKFVISRMSFAIFTRKPE